MLESKLESLLISGLKKLNASCRKVSWPGKRGAPDRLILHHVAPPLYVELKKDTGKLSEAQLREHIFLLDRGVKVVVVTGREGVKQFLHWYECAYLWGNTQTVFGP